MDELKNKQQKQSAKVVVIKGKEVHVNHKENNFFSEANKLNIKPILLEKKIRQEVIQNEQTIFNLRREKIEKCAKKYLNSNFQAMNVLLILILFISVLHHFISVSVKFPNSKTIENINAHVSLKAAQQIVGANPTV